jgi:hypothetical protein
VMFFEWILVFPLFAGTTTVSKIILVTVCVCCPFSPLLSAFLFLRVSLFCFFCVCF